MDRTRRSSLVLGIILLLLGAWFLAAQIVPGLGDWININLSWPWIVIGVGAFLLLLGLLIGEPDLAVPACIVAGIGALLYWQNATNRWESWAYVWTLIPGFVGVGVILSGLIKGRFSRAIREGGGLILLSLILFAIFASFLGGGTFLGAYWPILLILLGLWLLARPWVRAR